jgi:hypothetical protein
LGVAITANTTGLRQEGDGAAFAVVLGTLQVRNRCAESRRRLAVVVGAKGFGTMFK